MFPARDRKVGFKPGTVQKRAQKKTGGVDSLTKIVRKEEKETM